MMKINLQYFGGRGSAGGTNVGGAAQSLSKRTNEQLNTLYESAAASKDRELMKEIRQELAKRATSESTSTKTPVKSTLLEMERDMPQFAVSGVKEKGYKLMGKVDMSKSTIETGDSFGIRILGMSNYDVYGKVTKVTDSSITVSASGSKYNIPIKNVEVSGRELRFSPKNSNAGWFGFVDLRKYYTRDDFKKKR